jgi:hypothetical protein
MHDVFLMLDRGCITSVIQQVSATGRAFKGFYRTLLDKEVKCWNSQEKSF